MRIIQVVRNQIVVLLDGIVETSGHHAQSAQLQENSVGPLDRISQDNNNLHIRKVAVNPLGDPFFVKICLGYFPLDGIIAAIVEKTCIPLDTATVEGIEESRDRAWNRL